MQKEVPMLSEYEVKTIIDNYNDTISKFYEDMREENHLNKKGVE